MGKSVSLTTGGIWITVVSIKCFSFLSACFRTVEYVTTVKAFCLWLHIALHSFGNYLCVVRTHSNLALPKGKRVTYTFRLTQHMLLMLCFMLRLEHQDRPERRESGMCFCGGPVNDGYCFFDFSIVLSTSSPLESGTCSPSSTSTTGQKLKTFYTWKFSNFQIKKLKLGVDFTWREYFPKQPLFVLH